MAKDKGGRPTVPEHERWENVRSITRSCRLTPAEAGEIQAAADAKGVKVTQWMRGTLLRVARRIGKGR